MGDEKSYKVLFSDDAKTLLSLPEDYVGEYEIPYGVTCLNEKRNVFEKCNGLTAIKIPSTVKRLGLTSFDDCKNLKSIVIEPDNPFYDSREDCNAIIATSTNTLLLGCQNTIIPSGVKEISTLAFSGCTGLVSIRIPDSVREIGDAAFYNCTGLSSVEIGNGVSEISESAFENCTSLTSIEIPNSVTSIGYDAFYGCTGLTSIEIPNSVTHVGGFARCTGLTSINIPNSVTSIGYYAFYDCTGLKSIRCKAENPPYLFKKSFDYVDKKIPIYIPKGSLERYKKSSWAKLFNNFIEDLPNEGLPNEDKVTPLSFFKKLFK